MTKSRAELHLKGKQSFLFVSFFFLVFCFCCSLCKAPYLSAYMRTRTHIRHISLFFFHSFPFFFLSKVDVRVFVFIWLL